jgi:CBS domain-containing protein
MGFGAVYDYVGSKMDWIDSDLPFEGTVRGECLGLLAERSVPTCRPGESVSAARARMADRRASAVLNDDGVLLGLLPADRADGRVVDAMVEGPSTYRPHVTATELVARLERRRPDHDVVVTTLDGRLVGFVPTSAVRAAAVHS